jgi:hypothetical protein
MIEDIGQKFFQQQHICRIDCGNKWKIFRSSLVWTNRLGLARAIERIIVILSTRVQIPPFHHGGNLARAKFPSCTSTSISRTILFNRGGKLACVSFPFFTSTSSSRTTSFHHGGKLALAFPLAEAPTHLKQHHSNIGES